MAFNRSLISKVDAAVAFDYRPALLCAGAVLIGVTGWSGESYALAFTPLVVALWSSAKTRLWAGLVMLAYYLAASRGMLSGAQVFFTDPDGAPPSIAAGVSMWLTCGLVLASVWAICWGKRLGPVRALLALLLVSVPPFGILGWANPLTAAGMLLPGACWYGFGATLLVCMTLADERIRLVSSVVVMAAATLSNVSGSNESSTPVPPQWLGINTQLGSGRQADGAFERLRELQSIVLASAGNVQSGGVLLLPELVAGDWEMNAPWWRTVDQRLKEAGKTVLVGAAVPAHGGRSSNVMVALGEHTGVQLVNRMPVPGSMWQPWSAKGFEAAMGGSGVTKLGKQRVGHLICYEQLLMWPPLVTMASTPDILVAPSNAWWARGTSIAAIQQKVVRAWARLFGVPIVEAVNV